MDASWQPVQGSNPAAGVHPNDPAAAGGHWAAQHDPEWRSRIVSRIGHIRSGRSRFLVDLRTSYFLQGDSLINLVEILKKHLPASVLDLDGLNHLQGVAERFEEKMYTAATSQSDYLRKISLKLLSMELKRQQALLK
ncbi:mediator of RNA polymerase II transcription subunit 15a isoform X1 [Lolium perenne]|uniref:mediator of RNA polymerase II transcription subunit 15a isoform X1 n=1 Tax=Lolium perenne TaxID=4522 RepID=UPI0021F533E2|nr:mediator of RNA polymerase II transcription subunit 15a-like [Lolium perenne]